MVAQVDFQMDLTEVRGISGAVEQARENILRSWSSYMLRNTRERYRRMVTPSGQAWKPTAFKGDRHVRTLYGRGDLFRSIVQFKVGRWAVGIGSNLIYARTHQDGVEFTTTKKQAMFLFFRVFRPKYGKDAVFSWAYRIRIPARPYLGFAKSDVDGLEELAANHIELALRNPRR